FSNNGNISVGDLSARQMIRLDAGDDGTITVLLRHDGAVLQPSPSTSLIQDHGLDWIGQTGIDVNGHITLGGAGGNNPIAAVGPHGTIDSDILGQKDLFTTLVLSTAQKLAGSPMRDGIAMNIGGSGDAQKPPPGSDVILRVQPQLDQGNGAGGG